LLNESRYHWALFKHSVIGLDLKKCNYLLFGSNTATALGDFLDSSTNANIEQIVSRLVDCGIVNPVDNWNKSNIHDYRALRFQNFSSEIWASRDLGGRDSSALSIRLLSELLWCSMLLKFFGLGALTKLSDTKVESEARHSESGIREMKVPERFLKAALWSPFHVACLQMSFAVALEFRRRGVAAQLVIGVRPLPFVAHAWVEVNGVVYGDEAILPNLYGEIFRTPRN